MTIASQINADLVDMLADWGDTITIGGTEYNGIYTQEYSESIDYSGYSPVFTISSSDASSSSVSRGTSVTVTSTLNSLTAKGYKVRVVQSEGDGITKLTLTD